MNTTLRLLPYAVEHYDVWNRFVAESNNGTLFHRQDFLDYHGDRFAREAHHLIWMQGEEPRVLLPLGVFEQDGRRVARSPVGASWGGFVHGSRFGLQDARQVVAMLTSFLRDLDVDTCSVTLPPRCYYRSYSNHVEFALAECGFRPSTREITHAVRLPRDPAVVPDLLSKTCRYTARRALRRVSVEENVAPEDFYDILLADKRRHGAVPTHTLEELTNLHASLPGGIRIDIAHANGARAGICYFVANDRSACVFYMAQNEEARNGGFMNGLVLHGMRHFAARGFEWLDFGCSTYKMVVYEGVARFKESFGADGLFRDTYTCTLT